MIRRINNWFPLIFIFSLSFLITWPLFLPGYFSHHDDLHVMRIFEMRQCLSDTQIPCRWVPDMGYGNGYPLFNYYPPFPYYLGAVLSFIAGYVWAAKLLFWLALVIGPIGVYLLAKELFGPFGAITASVLFMFAPYRALDIYVRGAVAESFGMSIAPLVFYFFLILIRRGSLASFIGSTLALSLFLLSHNFMTIVFLPFLFMWVMFWMIWEKGKFFWFVALSCVFGFGMASFFMVPAYLERLLVQTYSLVRLDLNFRAHYATLGQMFFSNFWGYGASSPGLDDTISFQVGRPHWLVAGIAALASLVVILRCVIGKTFRWVDVYFNKTQWMRVVFICQFFTTFFLVSIFMMHNKSAFIWERIGVLEYAQFPWRFLSGAIFAASLLGGALIFLLRRKFQLATAGLLVVISIVFNFGYFRPEKFYWDVNDASKLSGIEWENQQKGAIVDYLPRTALEPQERAPALPLIRSGVSRIKNFESKSNYWAFEAQVLEDSRIEVPVFYFPNWIVTVNGEYYPFSYRNQVGRIHLDLPKGDYLVRGDFENTLVRFYSNFVSVASIILFAVTLLYVKDKFLA